MPALHVLTHTSIGTPSQNFRFAVSIATRQSIKGCKLKLLADVTVFPLPLCMQVIQKVYINISCIERLLKDDVSFFLLISIWRDL